MKAKRVLSVLASLALVGSLAAFSASAKDVYTTIDNCDDAARGGEPGKNATFGDVVVDTEDKQEGAGSLSRKIVAPGGQVFDMYFNTINLADKEAYLDMWVFVTDASKLQSNPFQICIGNDIATYQVYLFDASYGEHPLKLENGWTHLVLPLNDAQISPNEPNIPVDRTKLNGLRVYFAVTEASAEAPFFIKFDDIKIKTVEKDDASTPDSTPESKPDESTPESKPDSTPESKPTPPTGDATAVGAVVAVLGVAAGAIYVTMKSKKSA